MIQSKDEDPETKTSAKKAAVPRPASLAPPKPLAKSTKVATRPTFELPGEAVARRLKEQREARLSQQITPVKAAAVAAAVASPRPKSTKVPTVPTFELPGEAISRRKREEREARLRAQEEEERRRREFKAKPIRNSVVTIPRETIASRARQAKAQEDGTPMASKRISVISRISGASPVKSPDSRDHVTGTASQMSRATSSSNGSMSGKRSTLSAEDAQHQKLRGKEIFKRDNSLREDRERERRERELSAKIAREQAAERSRQASRDWAEKQRLKRLTVHGQAVTAQDI